MSELKRRARANRAPIAEGEFRNVTFRCGSVAYNKLIAEALKTGTSISAVIEALVEGGSAEDRMRSIAREEVARCWEMTSLAVAEEERAARQHDVATVEQVVNGRH